jgi:hypothetical protein
MWPFAEQEKHPKVNRFASPADITPEYAGLETNCRLATLSIHT